MAEPKAPPAPSPLLEGTVFIKNPLGAIHDMDSREPREQPVLEQAQKRQNGWQMASAEEIAAYCALHNLIPPGKKAKASVKEEEPVVEVVAEAEPRSASPSEEQLAVATAEAQEPTKRRRGRPKAR